MALSKTQIDKLGERLRSGAPNEADLRVLDEHRRSYGTAYDKIVQAIREKLVLQPTGRPAKSTSSIVEKLRRESIRLSQVQDIAGCRIVVPDTIEQERVVEQLTRLFPRPVTVDRRKNPSHGYRAVHVIVTTDDRLVEIQVRTEIQHAWAQMCEQLADEVDPGIKYGGGTEDMRKYLASSSAITARLEALEPQLAEMTDAAQREALKDDIQSLRESLKEDLSSRLGDIIEDIRSRKSSTK